LPLNLTGNISEDRLTLTIKHDRNLHDGETLCALLPDGPYALPRHFTPCCFQLAKAATSMSRTTSPCGFMAPAASNSFPWWVIPVGLGRGVGICAAAGCFNGDGGGGSNNVSR